MLLKQKLARLKQGSNKRVVRSVQRVTPKPVVRREETKKERAVPSMYNLGTEITFRD